MVLSLEEHLSPTLLVLNTLRLLQPPRPTTSEVGGPLSLWCSTMLLTQPLNGLIVITLLGDSTMEIMTNSSMAD